MQKCAVTLEPIQSGSGDPSPANPRPITGWTGTAVNVSGADTSTPTTLSVTFEPYTNTVYGGTYDFVSGVLTVDKALLTKNTSAMDNSENYPGWKNSGVKALMGEGISTVVYSTLNIGNEFSINTNNANDILFLSKNSYSKTQSEWISLAQDIQIIVPLAQHIEVQLTPQQISTLAGENNVWGDGTIELTYLSLE